MNLTDSFTVQAPVQPVWDLLLDFHRMAQCVPGVESIERVDDVTYRGRLKITVGIVTAVFGGTVKLLEVAPPNRIAAQIEADDRSIASQVKGTFTSTLAPVGDTTRVEYSMDVNLRGRLAQFGVTVVKATTRKLTAEFVECLQRTLDQGAPC